MADVGVEPAFVAGEAGGEGAGWGAALEAAGEVVGAGEAG